MAGEPQNARPSPRLPLWCRRACRHHRAVRLRQDEARLSAGPDGAGRLSEPARAAGTGPGRTPRRRHGAGARSRGFRAGHLRRQPLVEGVVGRELQGFDKQLASFCRGGRQQPRRCAPTDVSATRRCAGRRSRSSAFRGIPPSLTGWTRTAAMRCSILDGSCIDPFEENTFSRQSTPRSPSAAHGSRACAGEEPRLRRRRIPPLRSPGPWSRTG